MSLTYRFAPDAMIDFKLLPIPHQEAVLDLLEEVVDEPWRGGVAGQDQAANVYHPVPDADDAEVRVRLLNDAANGLIRVLGVREIPPP